MWQYRNPFLGACIQGGPPTKRDNVPETVRKWNQRYEQIETSCREKYKCTPCTYPNCQRSVRLTKSAVKTFGKG